MSVTVKFKKDIATLKSAANGEFYLDVKNPKLYKKLFRYYNNEGVQFSGDVADDYEILLDHLYSDLSTEGVMETH
jgi:1-aminocyclopropane-1-carboxylate deaminase/D-cysteine desulfhydrase-like pyridoxal-dependent ACC family enzyme